MLNWSVPPPKCTYLIRLVFFNVTILKRENLKVREKIGNGGNRRNRLINLQHLFSIRGFNPRKITFYDHAKKKLLTFVCIESKRVNLLVNQRHIIIIGTTNRIRSDTRGCSQILYPNANYPQNGT